MKNVDKYGLCADEYANNKNNANVYYNRAIGKSSEMEVSKALSKIISKIVFKDNKILDVGCATGHFYRSLKKRIKKNFFYTGCDPYEIFLKLGKKAWKKERNVNFVKGNIYDLPFKKNSFDIVYSSNVLLHLPEIVKPLKELLRVTKKDLILRTVVYDVSYKIQLVHNRKWFKSTNIKPEDEFDKKGDPRSFAYFNIHSFDYLKSVIKKISPKSKIRFIKDDNFSRKNITKSIKKEKRPLATKIIGKEQFSGAIMQPHYFVLIKK
jgi:ubiquinone/menaquinone biosynthesis C-methylase UbiE